jgi:hypothetical protein
VLAWPDAVRAGAQAGDPLGPEIDLFLEGVAGVGLLLGAAGAALILRGARNRRRPRR